MAQVSYIGYGALHAKAIAALTAGVTQSAEHLVGAAMAAAPVDTGTLRASIHVADVSAGGASVTARVATGGEAGEYAIAQHEGAGPHLITAVNGEALAWPGGAHPVKSVQHPGNPPTKFLEGPLLANRPVYLALLARAADGVF